MGLTTGDQRDALLDIAREKAKATSFARQLAQASTIYDHVQVAGHKIQDLAGAVAPPPGSDEAKKKKAADVKIISMLPPGHGFNPAGYYHHILLEYALGPQAKNTPSPAFKTADEKEERDAWGTIWAKDMTNPRKSTIYMVRATLTQLRVEPLVGGFILHWTGPKHWLWKDGAGSNTPVQVASNPLVLIRLVQSPATKAVNGTGFTCNVVAQYP